MNEANLPAPREHLVYVRPGERFASGPRARATVFQTEANLRAERWGRALDALQTASRIEPGPSTILIA